MTTAVGATASPGGAASSPQVRPPEERHDHRHSAEQRNHDARQSPPDKTTAAVAAALHTGYWQIDTAGAYFNEKPVGEGGRRSGPDRSEVFIEAKVWVPDFGRRDPPGSPPRAGRRKGPVPGSDHVGRRLRIQIMAPRRWSPAR
ncbi:aldo/keto reductase [Streptomyces sp. NBC_00996]|uniref:aldo/keto reductase n=1 Tax=Streptomyces sp. NBC_00996 TaxID=2903710 RepID=UPI0038647DA8